jgi:hypothetical protein
MREGLPVQPADLLRLFQNAAAAGLLDASTAPGVGDVVRSIGRVSLAFSGGAAGRDGDTVWLTGSATFLKDQPWSLRLTGKDAGNGDHPDWSRFLLSLSPPAGGRTWTFGDGFDGLPKSWGVPAGSSGMALIGSLIAPLPVQNPVLSAANEPGGEPPPPRLEGKLVLAGTRLEPYRDFVGDGPLPLTGTVIFPAAGSSGQPVLNLIASGAGSIDAGGLKLQPVGIQLRTDWPNPEYDPADPDPDDPKLLSAVLAYCKAAVGGLPATELTAPLLSGDYLWPIKADFGVGIGLDNGLAMISSIFGVAGDAPGGDAFSLPHGLSALDAFKLRSVEFGVRPPGRAGGTYELIHIAIDIASSTSWDTPLAFVRIDQVGVRWLYFVGSGLPLPFGSVWGKLTLGAKKGGSTGAQTSLPALTDHDGVSVTTTVTLPDMQVSASLDEPLEIGLPDFFGYYFEGPPPAIGNSSSHLTISKFNIVASVFDKHYLAEIEIDNVWSFKAGPIEFSLDELAFRVETLASSLSGELRALTSVTAPDGTSFKMDAVAAYPGDGHWEFEAQLVDKVSVTDFIGALIGTKAPEWMPDIEIAVLAASYSTEPGNPFSVFGLLEVGWEPELFGAKIKVATGAGVSRRVVGTSQRDKALALTGDDPKTAIEGSLSFALTINRFQVAAMVSVADSVRTYTFSIAWGEVKLIAATKEVGTGADQHQVLSVRMEGVTLGSIVEKLVDLANPNANYRLEPPWDFLNSINLDRFELIVDQKLKTVSLTYEVDIDLVFLTVAKVGLVYDRKGGEGSVRFLVDGNFIGQPSQTLEWDAVNENPPSVPGKGQALFDLGFLGVGQRVTPASLKGNFTSIADVIKNLRNDMSEADGPGSLPVGAGKAILFDPKSQWMIGLDCTIMETVSLKLVLHDPDLYGALITLSGPEAQALAGLSIELYYRKVTADVGVFHCRLQIPDAFRQLEFGAVSVTLGIITVDIFTNGNFKVDLGFPHNRDFTDSFAVEAGPFNGHGGLYFGLLDGATSDRVPKISNGTFSPVLELGVGLMVGLGRDFEKGPLSGGVYVDLVAIFEGVLGWFHPTDRGAPTGLYYSVCGTAGIVGKLYGSVDFKIISVSITLQASAFVTITLEAHQPSDVEFDVDVEVEASIHFLFFTVHFHFGLSFSTSFTIGQASPTPWTLAPGATVRSQAALAAGAHSPVRRRGAAQVAATRSTYLAARRGAPSPAAALLALASASAADEDGWHLNFDKQAKVFGGDIRPIALQVTPAFTIADPPVQWQGRQLPDSGSPKYKIAFLLSAQVPVPPTAQGIADCREQSVAGSAQAQTAADMAFPVLAEAMFRWALDAAGIKSPLKDDPIGPPLVTQGALTEIIAQLALPQASNQAFTMDNLEGFLSANLLATLSGTPAGGGATGISVAPFPVVPALQWTWSYPGQQPPPAAGSRDFSAYRPVGAQYEADVLDYFSKLDPRAQAHQPVAGKRLAAAAAAGETGESLASFVFRDYFLMVARAAVQAASDSLTAWPHTVEPGDSLRSIAGGSVPVHVDWTGAAGDSIETVAAAFGRSAAEIEAHNPGFEPPLPGVTAAVALGLTVQQVADSAADWPVTRGLTLDLGDMFDQARAEDTLAAIARRWLLADADAWLGSSALSEAPGILRAGAQVPLPGYVYPNPQNLDLAVAAALLFVRLRGGSVPDEQAPLAEWYVAAIAGLGCYTENGKLKDSFPVPTKAYDQSSPSTWTTLPGDSLVEVATALSLAQNVVAGSDFAVFLATATKQADNGIALAGAAATIAPRDTLATFAERLLFSGPADAAFTSFVRAADLLVPLSRVPVLAARMKTQDPVAPADENSPQQWTLLAAAQAAGLPLEDFAERVQLKQGLLDVQDKPLVIRDVPALGLDLLAAKLHDPGPAAAISGQVSRFMLNGLRLPTPVLQGGVWRAGTPMAGLYDLVGQQIDGPATSAATPETVRLELAMAKGTGAGWLQLAQSRVSEAGERVDMLAARHDQLHSLNPAAAARAENGMLPQGLVILTESVSSVTVTITEKDLADNYPSPTLAPKWNGAGLQPLPLSKLVEVHRPIAQAVRWRTTVAPVLPIAPPTGAQPGLWLLPGDLVSTAGGGQSAHAFDLMQLANGGGANQSPQPVAAWAWATLVDVAVQRIPGAPDLVEVHGADTADRQRLAQFLMHLGILPMNGERVPLDKDDVANLSLAWSLPPGPGDPQGLTTGAFDASASFLVKTNLSTETHSGRTLANARGAVPTAGEYFASLGDVGRLLTLFWECSVVGGGGYWLRLVDPKGEPLLPQAAFDQDGRTVLTLVLQLDSQSRSTVKPPGPPVRNLFIFNNALVVGDGVDPGSVGLYATAAGGAETQRQATVRAGETGFTLDLDRPTPLDSGTPELRAERLFSLLGYQLLGESRLPLSGEGQPLAPQVKRGPDGKPIDNVWNLLRIVPVRRFYPSRLADISGLPPSDDDPYAGVNPPKDPSPNQQPAQQQASAALWFHDLLGNTTSIDGEKTEPLPIVYTDPLLSPGAWPSTSLAFAVTGGEPAAASLEVHTTLQGAALQPSGAEDGGSASVRVRRLQERFGSAWYQVAQPCVTASLITTLHRDENKAPLAIAVPIAPLRNYAAAAYVLATSLSGLGAASARAADTGGPLTPASLSLAYGTDYDALGAVNQGTATNTLFGSATIGVPVFAVSDGTKSVTGICPAGVSPLTVLLAAQNGVLPLRPGAALATAQRNFTVPQPAEGQPTAPLTSLLQSNACTLADFAENNAAVANLLQAGAEFGFNGYSVAVGTDANTSGTTLDAVRAAFAAQGLDGVTVVDILQANGDKPGLFRPLAPLACTNYVAVRGDTLQKNGSGFGQSDLARLNLETPGPFAVGAPIYLQVVGHPTPTTPLGEFARQQGVTAGDLFAFNPEASLAESTVLLPGRYAWPADPSAFKMPLIVAAGATLDRLAAHLLGPGGQALALASANESMPGTVQGGLTLKVGGASVGTVAGDSFADVCTRAGKTLENLVAAIAGDGTALAPGALLIAPPGVLPGDDPLRPGDAAAAFSIDPAALLTANAGTPGLLAPGAVLKASPDDPTTETVAARDTLASLIHRFAHRGSTSSADLLVRANSEVAFLRGGAAIVLPLEAIVSASLGTQDAQLWPEPIFALHAWLRFDRPPGLCDPDLAADPLSSVASVRSIVAPRLSRDPATKNADPGAASLAAFASELEKALPALRIATGKVLSEAESAQPGEVWAVVFGNQGIESVAVTPPLDFLGQANPQPVTFALRPLSTTLAASPPIQLRPFVSASGDLGPAEPRAFQGVDLETWATTFLADVEGLLSWKLAPGAYRINRTALASIVAAKKRLAAAVATGLATVLEIKPAIGKDARDSAVATLKQALLASLSQGYATAAVLQYDAAVAGPWRSDSARLSGAARIVPPKQASTVPQSGGLAPSISNAKISLGEQAAGKVNFLLTVPDVARQEQLDLALEYRIVELEFNVVPEIEGYDRSDWIAFVNPVDSLPQLSVKLGTPSVPLPLRAYPPAAALLSHDAKPPSEVTTVAEAVLWSYQFRFRHQSAEQDRIELTVTLNAGPTEQGVKGAEADGLFGALAQYALVADPLRAMLSALSDPAKIADPVPVAKALDTFAGQADAVAAAWEQRWTEPLEEGVAPTALSTVAGLPELTFPMVVTLHSADDRYEKLVLERGSGGEKLSWPAIAVTLPDGTVVALTAAQGGSDSATCTYDFPLEPHVPAHILLSWELTFPGLHVAHWQDATAAVAVDRNAALMPPPAPGSNPEFVYRTPTASYARPVTPFIGVSQPIPIPAWSWDPLAGPLPAMFDTIFDGDSAGRTIALGVRYGYRLADGNPPIETYLPVVQSPSRPYGPATPADLVDAVHRWWDSAQPATDGGRLVIWIDLHSTLDPSLVRPLLQLKRLEAPLGAADRAVTS